MCNVLLNYSWQIGIDKAPVIKSKSWKSSANFGTGLRPGTLQCWRHLVLYLSAWVFSSHFFEPQLIPWLLPGLLSQHRVIPNYVNMKDFWGSISSRYFQKLVLSHVQSWNLEWCCVALSSIIILESEWGGLRRWMDLFGSWSFGEHWEKCPPEVCLRWGRLMKVLYEKPLCETSLSG